MRWVLSTLLVLTLALGLSACASGAAPAPTGSPAKPSEAPKASVAASASPATSAAPAAKPAASPYAPGAPLSPRVKVKLASLGGLGESPLAIAIERGYFSAEGLDTESVGFKVTSDSLPALALGEIDVAIGGVNPALFNAVSRGVIIKIVGDGATRTKGHDNLGIAIRTDHLASGRYKTPKDLKGMKVGLPGQYALLHYVMKVLLEQNGLTLKDVELVPVGNAESIPAMANKALDAMAGTEPNLSQMEQQGSAKRVLDSVDIVPGLNGGVFLMSPKLAERSRDAADRLVIAWMRGLRDYLDAFDKGKDRDAVIAMLKKNNINYAPNAQSPTFDPNGRFKQEGLQQVLNWYVEEGVVKEKVDLKNVVDFSFVDRAAQRLGAYQ